jgi:bifunctional non-homologous end joining protein LigD
MGIARTAPGIAINATYNGDSGVIYQHACTLGCEGIVSKRLGSPYRAGRTDQWLKMKNPHAPAVRREREIDWAVRGRKSLVALRLDPLA